MKILVLGANGQLGVEIMQLGAEREGVSCHGLGRPQVDAFDLAATEATLDGLSFDVVVNCVAATRVDDCERLGGEALAINAQFAATAARLCRARDARLVQVSTDYVFGGQAERSPLAEDAARRPVNVYGASKALGEDLALFENPETLVVRVASLFGPAGASGKGGNFVETMIRMGRERGALRVVADQVMSPTSATDAAVGILDLIQVSAPAGTYHVVNAGQASWCEFASTIVRRAGVSAEVAPITTGEFSTLARRPPYSVLSPAKLERTIGRPMPDWHDALDRYLVAKGHRAR